MSLMNAPVRATKGQTPEDISYGWREDTHMAFPIKCRKVASSMVLTPQACGRISAQHLFLHGFLWMMKSALTLTLSLRQPPLILAASAFEEYHFSYRNITFSPAQGSSVSRGPSSEFHPLKSLTMLSCFWGLSTVTNPSSLQRS